MQEKKKKYPNNATVGALKQFYFNGRGLHTRHTHFPNKKKGIRESRLPFGSAANGWPLVHSCPGGTCLLGTHGLDRSTSSTPLARPPCSPHSRPAAHPRTRSQGSRVKQESHRTQPINASSNTTIDMRLSPWHVRSAPRTALLSRSPPPVLALRPLFGACSALSANRGRTRLLPSSP